MKMTQEEIATRLLYLLHLSLVEARDLALRANHQQIADLADAFEVLPRYVHECDEDGLEMIRYLLKSYQDKYPESPFAYAKRFEECETPQRF